MSAKIHVRSKRINLYRLLICGILILFVIILTGFLIWLILRPTKPRFTLQDATIYAFNPSSASLLNSSIQVTIISRNPNDKLGIYYGELDVYATYRNQQITLSTKLPPTYQGHKTSKFWSPLLMSSSIPVESYIGVLLSQDQSAGMVVVNIEIDGRVRWKVGSWKSGRFHLHFRCPANITFGDRNTDMGGPKKVKTGESSSTPSAADTASDPHTEIEEEPIETSKMDASSSGIEATSSRGRKKKPAFSSLPVVPEVPDTPLLKDRGNHISAICWTQEKSPITGWRCSWKPVLTLYQKASPSLKDALGRTPLGPLLTIPRIQSDWRLVAALCERWFGETNTFHFPCYKLTITPLDIVMLTGIPIVAEIYMHTCLTEREITVRSPKKTRWRVMELLGVETLLEVAEDGQRGMATEGGAAGGHRGGVSYQRRWPEVATVIE
ncbi:hypothetical protein HHK36_022362 [Tetracentron sinense]|uniref:Late embryogenesis abundant protein LEA-2 subgroup domain-containing protein n=1 Tax=Tetracentron sinense TaxID=13715 RepID=A0A834YPG5_TETSI|nr:hypothetical protein HHK36_022362 [Tetracentron sinense]